MIDPFHEPRFLLRMEVIQREQEGCDTSGLRDLVEGEGQPTADTFDRLYRQLDALALRADFPFDEPSELEAIRAARPDGPRRLNRPDDAALTDRLRGAWLGRAAGCQLGKPLEGMTRADIETYLKAANAYPLDDYVPWMETPPVPLVFPLRQSTRGNFSEMARDDDMDYTVMGLHILEQHGAGFTTADVAGAWLGLMPFHMVYTAERVTYQNLVNDFAPETAGGWRNPYREWIGAQIRADQWGYAAPGWPERAAEFAWRDAALSHRKNGIYGEMWAAAMIAAAFSLPGGRPTAEQIEGIIRAGLAEIPAHCRLAEAIERLMGWRREVSDWREARDRIEAGYGHYHWVHTINNALLVALGLLYGEGDFTASIGIAVMGGWDTDCNGATVGSILGAALGSEGLPERWTAPLNDRLRSAVVGFDGSRFSELAERSARAAVRA